MRFAAARRTRLHFVGDEHDAFATLFVVSVVGRPYPVPPFPPEEAEGASFVPHKAGTISDAARLVVAPGLLMLLPYGGM